MLPTQTEPITLAFVCVQNAGRSQMAYAFAKRERAERGLEDEVTLITGGTHPANHVHNEVVNAMADIGIDLDERTPREVTIEEISNSDYVITMGCESKDVCPSGWAGENRDWGLDDPDGQAPIEVARIREEIERRVRELFDEVEQAISEKAGP